MSEVVRGERPPNLAAIIDIESGSLCSGTSEQLKYLWGASKWSK